MALEGSKKVLIQHDRPPTEEEIDAFQAICRSTDRVVLAPVIVNQQERFALALLSDNGSGGSYLEVLAFIALPTDEVLEERGSSAVVRRSSVNRDLN